jgi:transcriptional regulator with XRE-family HTH domain
MTERDRLSAGVRMALAMMQGSKMDKARRLGVSTNTLRMWESGLSEPRSENISRLARQSGMSEEDIRAGRLSANLRTMTND